MALLRKAVTLPGVQVWSGMTADACSRLDVPAAVSRTVLALKPVGLLLGKHITSVISPATQGPSADTVFLDPAGLDGLKRLQQRAQAAQLDLWQLLWSGDAASWEQLITLSFAAGVSLHLEEATLQHQVVHEFRVALLVGRRLCFAADCADLAISLKRAIEYRLDGDVAVMEVELLFPGEARSVTRLVHSWWDAKGGKPSTKEAKLAHAAAKPSSRAMPTQFGTNILMLYYWQSKLLTALVDVNQQMTANKVAGFQNWHHPGSLCSGARYASGSACAAAVQSAMGMLSCAWHLATGGRQAEFFRCRGTDSGADGVAAGNSKPPVWALGLAGADVLRKFQQEQSTGWFMINWHAKGMYDYGTPDYMPFWPSCMSGICLGAIINFAKTVLTFLQPVSPSKPIIKDGKKGAQPQQTLNNARGYLLPFAELKHLPALDGPASPSYIPATDMARIINAAISAAGFLGRCWQGVRAAGSLASPVAAIANRYHSPSEYSKRYTLAGEASLMLQLLGTAILPSDFWVWYLQRAGRSELTHSFATYVKAYVGAFGGRLPYIREAGRAMAVVQFRTSMLSWSPLKANQDVCTRLSDEQRSALEVAVQWSKGTWHEKQQKESEEAMPKHDRQSVLLKAAIIDSIEADVLTALQFSNQLRRDQKEALERFFFCNAWGISNHALDAAFFEQHKAADSSAAPLRVLQAALTCGTTLETTPVPLADDGGEMTLPVQARAKVIAELLHALGITNVLNQTQRVTLTPDKINALRTCQAFRSAELSRRTARLFDIHSSASGAFKTVGSITKRIKALFKAGACIKVDSCCCQPHRQAGAAGARPRRVYTISLDNASVSGMAQLLKIKYGRLHRSVWACGEVADYLEQLQLSEAYNRYAAAIDASSPCDVEAHLF